MRTAPAHTQLRMVPHALLNDLSHVFERGPELLLAVVAQCDVVRQLGLIPQHRGSVDEPARRTRGSYSRILDISRRENHTS